MDNIEIAIFAKEIAPLAQTWHARIGYKSQVLA